MRDSEQFVSRLADSVKNVVEALTNRQTAMRVSVVEVLSDIETQIEDETKKLPEREREHVAGILFGNYPGSLKSFVLEAMSPANLSSNTVPAKSLQHAFSTMTHYMNAAPTSVCAQHRQNIRKMTREVFVQLHRLNAHATVQAGALELLLALLKRGDHMEPVELDLTDITNTLLHHLPKVTGQSAKSNALQILGRLCRLYPTDMLTHQNRVKKCFLDTLKGFRAKKEVQNTAAEGLMLAFCDYLAEFALSFSGEEDVEILYQFVRAGLLLSKDTHRYHLPKAALKVLQYHSMLLKAQLMRSVGDLMDLMMDICGHKNVELHKQGYPAATAFVQTVASEICENSTPENVRVEALGVLVSRAKMMLQSSEHYMLSFGIVTYGQLARPIAKYSPENDLNKLLETLQKKLDSLMNRSQSEMEDATRYLPQFVAAVASVLLEIRELSRENADNIERLLDTVLLVYPRSFNFPKLKEVLPMALLKLFTAARRHQHLWASTISFFSTSGIKYSAASSAIFSDADRQAQNGGVIGPTQLTQNSPEAEQAAESSEEGALYEEYMKLWNGLLQPPRENIVRLWGFPWTVVEGVSATAVHDLVHELRQEILFAIIGTFQRLDLAWTSQPNANGEGQPAALAHYSRQTVRGEMNVVPTSRKDYLLFLNLCPLSVALMPLLLKGKTLEDWGSHVCTALIDLGFHYPHASGLYSVLRVTVREMHKGGCFDSKHPSPIFRRLQHTLQHFFSRCLSALDEFNDELLASASMCLLSFPTNLVAIEEMQKPLLHCLDLGVEQASAAMAALEAIASWMEGGSATATETILPVAIPKMKRYLEGSATASAEFVDRLLEVVGKEGLRVGEAFATSNAARGPQKLKDPSMDPDDVLRIKLPLGDHTTEFRMNPLLPRLIGLVRDATDRKTRVSACELLHSITLWIIGSSAQRTDKSKTSPYKAVLEQVLPIVVELSVSTDAVIKRMFESLLHQVARWYTSRHDVLRDESTVFFDGVFEALGAPYKGTSRNACATVVAEVLKHSSTMDPTSRERLAADIFRRLSALLEHPSCWCHLGAAMAFNRLHGEFMRSQSLIKVHTVQLLESVLKALSAVDGDTVAGVAEQLQVMVEHLEKIIAYNGAQFCDGDAGFTALDRMVQEVFETCGAQSQESRSAAMLVFGSLVTTLPSFNTEDGPTRWVKLKQSKEPQFLQGMFRISAVLSEPHTAGLIPFLKYEAWTRDIEAAIDCHVWLINCNYLSATVAFGSHIPAELHQKKRRAELHLPTGKVTAVSQTSLPRSHLLKHIHAFLLHADSRQPIYGGAVDSQTEWVVGASTASGDALTAREKQIVAERRLAVLSHVATLIDLLVESYPTSLWTENDSESKETHSGVFPLLCTVTYSIAAKLLLSPAEVFGAIALQADFRGNVNVVAKRLSAALWRVVNENMFEAERPRILNTFMERMPLNPTVAPELAGCLDSGNDPMGIFSGLRTMQSVGLLVPVIQLFGRFPAPGNVSSGMMRAAVDVATLERLQQPQQRDFLRTFVGLIGDIGVSGNELLEAIISNTGLSQGTSVLTRTQSSFLPTSTSGNVSWISAFPLEVHAQMAKLGPDFMAVVDSAEKEGEISTSLATSLVRTLFEAVKDNESQLVASLNGWNILNGKERLPLRLQVLRSMAASNSQSLISCIGHSVARDIVACLGGAQTTYHQHTLLKSTKSVDLVKEAADLLRICSRSTNAIQNLCALVPFGDLINIMIANELPVRVDELAKGSPEFENYLAVVEALVIIIESCGAFCEHGLIFRALSLFRFKEHPLNSRLACAIPTVLDAMPADSLEATCQSCFLQLRGSMPPDTREAIVSRVAMPILRKLHHTAAERIFETEVCSLMEICSQLGFVGPAEAASTRCVQRTSAFTLLEVLYRVCDAGSIKDRITKAFAGSEAQGSEITQKLSRVAHAAASYVPDDNTILTPEELLRYHQAAYSCLVSVIIATQRKEGPFQSLLFRDINIQWHAIVDLKASHKFSTYTTMKKVKTSVAALQSAWERQADAKASVRGISRVKFNASQYFVDSHVDQDSPPQRSDSDPRAESTQHSIHGVSASQNPRMAFERKKILIASMEQELERGKDGVSVSPAQQFGEHLSGVVAASVEGNTEEDIELDSIWESSCFVTLLRLVDTMTERFRPYAGQSCEWLNQFVRILSSPTSHLNVRLAIVKLIVLRPDVFSHVGSELFAPMIDAITQSEVSEGIHYILRDVVTTFVGWPVVLPPSGGGGQAAAGKLISYLVQHLPSSENYIMRSNLELLKTLLNCWKDRVYVNKRDLLAWLTVEEASEKSKTARMCGVQICGVLVNVGVPLYQSHLDRHVVNEDTFYRRVVDNIKYPRGHVSEATAEMLGMALAQLTSQSTTGDDQAKLLRELTFNTLSMMAQGQTHTRFLKALTKLAEHFPTIVDNFLPSKLYSGWSSLTNEERRLTLQMTTLRGEYVADAVYPTLCGVVTDFGATSMPDSLRLALFELLAKLVPFMTSQKDLTHVCTHWLVKSREVLRDSNVECRAAFYKLCAKLYDEKADQLDGATAHTLNTMISSGLEDESPFVQETILNFWDHELRLPIRGVERFKQLLSKLQTPALGSSWLKHGAVLMLYLTYRDADFQSTDRFFPQPLAACTFKDIELDNRIMHGTLPMTPMFSSSEQTPVSQLAAVPQSLSGTSLTAPVAASIRKKELLKFTPTLKNERVVLTTMAASQSTQATSSTRLLFATQQPSTADDNGPQVFIKRRFRKSNTRMHIIHASQASQARRIQEQEQKQLQENAIVVHRRFRDGDIPDIQISLQTLVAPLQAVCLHDVQVAKIVLTSVGDSLMQYVHAKAEGRGSLASGPRQTLTTALGMETTRVSGAGVATDIAAFKSLRQQLSTEVQRMMFECTHHRLMVEFAQEMLLCLPTVDGISASDIFECAVPTQAYAGAALVLESLHGVKQSKKGSLGTHLMLALRGAGDHNGAHATGLQLVDYRGDLCDKYKHLLQFSKLGEHARAAEVAADLAVAVAHDIPKIKVEDPFHETLASSLLHEQRRSLSKLLEWGDVFTSCERQFPDGRITRSGARQDLIQFLVASPRCGRQDVFDQALDACSNTGLSSLFMVERSLGYFKECTDKVISGAAPDVRAHMFRDCVSQTTKFMRQLLASADAENTQRASMHQLHLLYEINRAAHLIGSKALTPERIKIQFLNTVREWQASTTDSMAHQGQLWYDLDMVRGEVVRGMVAYLQRNTGDLSGQEHDVNTFMSRAADARRKLCTAAGRSLCVAAEERGAALYFLSKKQMGAADASEETLTAILECKLQQLRGFKGPTDTLREHFNGARRFLNDKSGHMFRDEQGGARKSALQGKIWAQEVDTVLSNESYTPQNANELHMFARNAVSCCEDATSCGRSAQLRQAYTVCLDVAIAASKVEESPSSGAAALALNGTNMLIEYLQHFADMEARQHFALLLQVVDRYPSAAAEFEQKAGTIPIASIKPWVSQLISMLLSNNGYCVAALVVRLAKHEPHILFYPTLCARDDLLEHGKNPSVDQRVRVAINHLNNQLFVAPQQASYQRFANALGRLHHPQLRLKQWWSELRLAIRKCHQLEQQKMDATGAIQDARRIWNDCWEDCFNDKADGIGDYNRKFARDYGPTVRNIMCDPLTGVLRATPDLAKMQQQVNQAFEHMQVEARGTFGARLESFSHELAHLNPKSTELRLPTQPFHLLHHDEPHVFVVGTGHQVLVMGSKEKPKRLSLLTETGTHNFLVKGGDDLRLDQRVEELFTTVNSSLYAIEPSQRALRVRCFSVIPVTKKIGLVEWVDGTEPMKAAIERSMRRDDQLPDAQSEVNRHPAFTSYQAAIDSISNTDFPSKFLQTYLNPRFTNAQGQYATEVRKWMNMVNPQYLQGSLAGYGTSRSAYFDLQRNFIDSYAAQAMCSYIMGIGDRHLDNFLLDTNTAEVVPIDFGMSFGIATTSLRVPELIPFRLTPQIEGTLGIGGKNRMALPMLQTMKAIQRQRGLIEGLINVFLREPLLTWEQGNTQRTTDFVGKRIASAQRRLDLVHPSTVVLEDVRENRYVEATKTFSAIKNALPPAVDRPLGMAEHVDVLIQIATDENILGRTWIGWSPVF